jgi:hypothetical protein
MQFGLLQFGLRSGVIRLAAIRLAVRCNLWCDLMGNLWCDLMGNSACCNSACGPWQFDGQFVVQFGVRSVAI